MEFNFFKDSRGFAAIVFAFLIPILIAVIGLSTEANVWYDTRTRLQAASDMAARAASIELGRIQPGGTINTGSGSAIHNAVMKVFTDNGFNALSSVEINIPPVSGPNAGNTQAVEVIAHDELDRLFSSLFFNGQQEITTRSVVSNGSSSLCMLALGQTVANTVTGTHFNTGGNLHIDEPNCVWASNTPPSARINGGISLQVDINSCGPVDGTIRNFYTVGTYQINNSCLPQPNIINTTAPNVTNATPMADPYDSMPFPAVPTGPCDAGGGTYAIAGKNTLHVPSKSPGGKSVIIPGNVVNIPPGIHCDLVAGGPDIQINFLAGTHVFLTSNAPGGSTLAVKSITFEPGQYFIDGLTLNLVIQPFPGAGMKATDVTFFLGNSKKVVSPGSLTIDAGGLSTVTMSAATSGAYTGFLIFGDKNMTWSDIGLNSTFRAIQGYGNPLNITGRVYNPKGSFFFSTGVGGTLSCVPVIAYEIWLSGGANIGPLLNLDMNCPVGFEPPQTAGGNGGTNLVE